MYVCSDTSSTCLSHMRTCSNTWTAGILIECHNADASASDSSTGDHEVDYMLFQWSSWGECSTKCTCNARREEKVRSKPVLSNT